MRHAGLPLLLLLACIGATIATSVSDINQQHSEGQDDHDSSNPTFASYVTRKREQFRVVYEWKTLNFTWKSQQNYDDALKNEDYIPKNVILSGMKYFNDRLYVTLPRMKDGVPATIAWIPAKPQPNNTSPLLTPFPSWELNTVGDCRGFQSVQSIEIDTTGRMWVIDNGQVSSTNRSNPSCLPSLAIIDLNDDRHSIVRYNFPESVVNSSSYLNEIVVDDTDGGYAYITDKGEADPGIVVYRKVENQSWKFRDANSMRAAKNAVKFDVGDVHINMSVNIDGIALGPRYVNKKNVIDRNVYYSPLSSYRLYGTPTSVLRNVHFSSKSPELRSKLVVNLGRKSSQTDGMIMDEEGYLFYGLVGSHSIAHWDHKTNFNTNQEIIARDKSFIQWVDRFAFDNMGNLYFITNKLHNYVADKVDVDQVNYRILCSHVGTKSYLYSPVLVPLEQAGTKRIVTKSGANSVHGLTVSLIVMISMIFTVVINNQKSMEL